MILIRETPESCSGPTTILSFNAIVAKENRYSSIHHFTYVGAILSSVPPTNYLPENVLLIWRSTEAFKRREDRCSRDGDRDDIRHVQPVLFLQAAASAASLITNDYLYQAGPVVHGQMHTK